MNETALFRFDVGPGAGLGHLSRCLSLGEALRRDGIRRVMLMPADERMERQVLAAGHVVERRRSQGDGAGGDIAEVIAVAREHGCRWVVVDSYRIRADGLTRLRESGVVVVAIDDLAREPLPAQIVVNGGAQARSLNYESILGDTRFLLGPAFALLRPEFWRPARRQVAAAVDRVMVTMGGSDPDGATLAVLESAGRRFDLRFEF